MSQSALLLDQVFSRINSLQKEHDELVAKINQITNAIREKKKSLVMQLWTTEDKVNEEKTQKHMYEQLHMELSSIIQSQIKSDSVKYTFIFTPFEKPISPVFISGDFNNWTMSEMIRECDTYIYTTSLKKGFEYSYCFFSDGQKMVDFNSPLKEIPKMNNCEFNFVSIPDDNGNSIQIWKTDPHTLPINFEIDELKITGDEDKFIKQMIEIIKLENKHKNHIVLKRRELFDGINKTFNEKIQKLDLHYRKTIKDFNDKFIGRLILHNNVHYELRELDLKSRRFKCLRLYDPNGIKVNHSIHHRHYYQFLQIESLFNSAIFLSKIESQEILRKYNDDHEHYLIISYQLQSVDRLEKELIPYKIEPETVEISQYDLEVNDNLIKNVKNKDSDCFVYFKAIYIGDTQTSSGLVSSSIITVYTTLYSKDILNILHIHLDDTSQEITVDSEFLEKDENIQNHKTFYVDAFGKRLNYKLLFKDYRLIKIYYSMSNDFIDEPLFKEIRFPPNSIVKLMKGEYKNFYGMIKQFPIGMLARKDKEQTELKKMKSFGYEKEGVCGDRHLGELPGFVSIEVSFNDKGDVLEKTITLSVPVCHLISLTPKEEVLFEKKLALKKKTKDQEKIDFIERMYNDCKEYEGYLKSEVEFDKLNLDKLKEILGRVEKKINWNEYNIEGENLGDKIAFIKDIQLRITPILFQKIRIKVLSGGK